MGLTFGPLRVSVILGVILLVLFCQSVPAVAQSFQEEADASIEEWLSDINERFRELAFLPEGEFIAAWQEEYETQIKAVRALPGYDSDAVLADRTEARVLYEWAFGRLLYPAFHAGLTETPDFTPSEQYNEYLEALNLERDDFLDLEEFTAFIIRKRDYDADALLRAGGDAYNNGARDLTTRRLANGAFTSIAVRCYLERAALLEWLEDFAADGLTNEPDEIAEACPGPETDKLVEYVEEERAQREGHPIREFKNVNGNALELHIYPSTNEEQTNPGLIWLHGGGWQIGSWSWCGPCIWFKERGHVVVQVEYRVEGRHGSTIPDSYQDTVDAIKWIRENAAEFGIDPDRIAVAGFSAGGHLALSAATFEPHSITFPNLALSISGCTDLTNDPYSVEIAGGEEAAAALSPLLSPSSIAPPMFLANGGFDRLCSFEEAQAFVEAMREIGRDVDFHEEPEGTHFFLRDAERAARTKEALFAFLEKHGF